MDPESPDVPSPNPDLAEDVKFRFDLVYEDLTVDEETMTLSGSLVPDPRRYERMLRDGETVWFDKLDRLFFTAEVMASAASQLVGQPIYYQQQDIGNVPAYVTARRPEIESMLDGDAAQPTFEDRSEAFLESLANDHLGFAILVVDIVGSTSLSQALDAATYARVMATTLTELSLVVPAFRGHVLKYTGDGLIAYFPEPSFIIKNDLAIDCALTLRVLVRDGINAALNSRGLPTLEVRMGLDSGEASVVTMGSDATKQHKDIIGATVSLAAKTQARAQPGLILVGETADRNLHVSWREHLEEFDPGPDWPYTDAHGEAYKLFRVGRDPSSGPRIPRSTPSPPE